MITNKGSEVIVKFMLEQTSSYARYLAIGCGYNQLTGENFTYPPSVLEKKCLDFEMIRVPIISKGLYVDENGVKNLIFKAELPTEQRFKITEVGLYPDLGNALAGAFDSKRIAGFIPSENWVDKNTKSITDISSAIVDSNNEIIADIGGQPFKLGYVTDENSAWNHPARKKTLQPPRYFDKSIMARGDLSTIDRTKLLATPVGTGGNNPIGAGSDFVKTNKLVFNFNENSADDIFKLAFALIPKAPADEIAPDNIMIVIDLLNDYSQSSSFARWVIDKDPTDFVGTDTENYFYHVAETTKSGFVLSDSNFSWAAINGVRIYVSAQNSGVADSDWHVLLDGMRIENVTTENPLYGLVGYKVIDTDSGQPVIKQNNTVNFVEFRFTAQV